LNTEPQDRPILARDVVAALVDARHCAAVRMWRRRELPRRAAVSVALITLMLLLYGPLSRLPAIESLENMAVDLRLAYQPRRPPDRRIVLISIDDATVAADSTPLPDMADQAGAVLGTVFDAGARTVGIDLLLPERWSLSEPFSKLILNHASNLVLAGYSTAEGTVTGPEAIQGATAVALGPANVEQLYAFVNVSPDSDGVVRTMPLFYRNQRETLVPSFAARVAEVFMTRSLPSSGDSRLWLDYSIEWTKFQRVSWKDVRHLSATRPDAFRGAVVLVGADFVGSGDIHSVRALAASTPRHVSGLVLHALALNTLLEGTLIRTSPRTVVMALLAVTAGLAAMAILSFPRPGGTVGIVATSTILYVAFSFLLFRRRHELSPIVGPVVTMSVLVVCALVVRGRLAPHPVATAIPETLP
jgi:CHASE2 domain-containing sensor protein